MLTHMPPCVCCLLLLLLNGSFLFKDQFIELTTAVPADSDLYGLGESTLPQGLLLPRDGSIRTMWARDAAPAEADINTYGAHPFYLQVNKGEERRGPIRGATAGGNHPTTPTGLPAKVSAMF